MRLPLLKCVPNFNTIRFIVLELSHLFIIPTNIQLIGESILHGKIMSLQYRTYVLAWKRFFVIVFCPPPFKYMRAKNAAVLLSKGKVRKFVVRLTRKSLASFICYWCYGTVGRQKNIVYHVLHWFQQIFHWQNANFASWCMWILMYDARKRGRGRQGRLEMRIVKLRKRMQNIDISVAPNKAPVMWFIEKSFLYTVVKIWRRYVEKWRSYGRLKTGPCSKSNFTLRTWPLFQILIIHKSHISGSISFKFNTHHVAIILLKCIEFQYDRADI